MRIVTRSPSPALASFVERLWYFEAQGALPHSRERLLPNGSMQLLVNLAGNTLRHWDGEELAVEHVVRGAAIVGVYARPIAISTDDQRAIVGVLFRPGGAFPFVRPEGLAGQHVPLGDVWGRDGELLRERMLEHSKVEARLDVLERVLLEKLHGCTPPDNRIARAVRFLCEGGDLADLRAHLGSSERSFVRRFVRDVGVTPKRYARIVRFSQLVRELAHSTRPRWAALAVEHGFFDQAHMIHEFKELAGVTPAKYHARSPEDPHHVPL